MLFRLARIAPIVVLCLGAASSFAADRLLSVDTNDQGLYEINPTTAARTFIATLSPSIGAVGALAYDANTDTLYASSTSNNALYKLDYNTGATTLIGAYGVGSGLMHSLVFQNGTLFGTTTFGTNQAYTINTTTGVATANGAISVNAGDMAYNPLLNKTYISEFIGTSLHEINPLTGATTLIGSFGSGGQTGVGMAWSSTFGLLATDNDSDRLFRVNEGTGAATLIGGLGDSNHISLAFLTAPVPEPATMAALGLGLLALARKRRR